MKDSPYTIHDELRGPRGGGAYRRRAFPSLQMQHVLFGQTSDRGDGRDGEADKQGQPARGAFVKKPKLNVLVVEDNPINQRLALRLLEKHGHAAVCADNGRKSVVRYQAQKF